MRIIFVTQRVDPHDPLLGATVAKLRALAALCTEVVVVTDGAVPGVLPDNCRIRSFRARTRVGRGLRFGAILLSEHVRRRRPAAVVAHMCPIYAVLAAPVARPFGARVILWFTHWKDTTTLRIAERSVSSIATVDARSVPVVSTKVVAIGHGIELDDHPCRHDDAADGALRIATLGRFAESKGLAVVVRGVAAARARGVDVRFEARGPVRGPEGEAVLSGLHALAAELDLANVTTLAGPIPHTDVSALFRRTDLFVNNMRAGAADKAVFEAGAACVPVVASNPSFSTLLDGLAMPLRFERDAPDQLALLIESFAQLDAERRAEIGRALRLRVAAEHSVQSWAARIVELAAA